MRVCQIGTGFLPVLPDVPGGVERYVHNLGVALQRLAHDVLVIDIPVDAGRPCPYGRSTVHVSLPSDSNSLAHVVRGLLFGLAASRRLEQAIEEGRVDLVNFHSQFTALAGIPVARRHGIPTVFTMHNPLWSDIGACRSLKERTRFWLERRAEAQADHVIGLSETVASNRVRYFGLLPSKITVIPVAIDDCWFEHQPVSAEIGRKYAPNGEVIVLQVGRIAAYKNQLLLIKALAAILNMRSNVRVVFAGPIGSRKYFRGLQSTIVRLGASGKIMFAGEVQVDELAQLYHLAHVVVLPSLRENFPQAALEAMAQGKAIIASRIGAHVEILGADAGLIVPSADERALAQTLLELLLDGRLRSQLGMRARSRAYELYRWDAAAERVVDVYGQLLKSWPSNHASAGLSGKKS